MQNSLLTCDQWARKHFSSVDLGDCRLSCRLVKVAAALASKPGGTLPAALPRWPDLKAAYRLLDNPSLTFEKAGQPHWLNTLAACSAPGRWLLIEDSTSLNFSSRTHLSGIGRIGDDRGRGINLHTNLAFAVGPLEPGEQPRLSLVGVAGQQLWVRGEELNRGNVPLGRERKQRRFARSRESERWGKTLAGLPAPSPGCQRIYIADRESDIYELFERCEQAACDYVIRACQDRALLEAPGPLMATIGQQPELGRYQLELRARPGTPARTVTIAIRTATVLLRAPWRPGKKSPRQMNVVQAREINPPAGAREINWTLLTNLACANFEEARQVVKLYACRWIIEEYHKALKTGAGIEQSQLQEYTRIKALAAILSLVAARLLGLKLEAGQDPEVLVAAGQVEPEVLQILEATFGPPKGGWTQHNLWISIARMGGYLARNSDGPPGWQTSWRGWQRLSQMVEGVLLVKPRCG
ncbi:MAG: transposase family protein [Verrucomicrobiales bacterium]|nr:transposase family protein [Verrucomicrobiales bacterium]